MTDILRRSPAPFTEGAWKEIDLQAAGRWRPSTWGPWGQVKP